MGNISLGRWVPAPGGRAKEGVSTTLCPASHWHKARPRPLLLLYSTWDSIPGFTVTLTPSQERHTGTRAGSAALPVATVSPPPPGVPSEHLPCGNGSLQASGFRRDAPHPFPRGLPPYKQLLNTEAKKEKPDRFPA